MEEEGHHGFIFLLLFPLPHRKGFSPIGKQEVGRFKDAAKETKGVECKEEKVCTIKYLWSHNVVDFV